MNENKMYIVRQYNTPTEMEEAMNIMVRNNYIPFEIFYGKGYYNVVYRKL